MNIIMRTVGGLILFIAIGLLLIAGLSASGSLLEEASTNDNSTPDGVQEAISPIFLVLGFCGLMVGITLAINAFR